MRPQSFDPSAQDGAQHHLKTLKTLIPYLWPEGELGLKSRVVAAVVLLVSAKLLNVYVPFLLKDVVDALAPTGDVTIYIPIAMIVAYCLGGIMVEAFNQLRDAVFAVVGQNALRNVAYQVFRHLHKLALRFHLDRRTGGLSRVVERGVKGIDFLLRFSLFNVAPTIIEICLIGGVLYFKFDVWFAAVAMISIAIYIWFTFAVTEWRLKFRREMNKQDTDANTRAVDSLLNYETVKYFGNEEHESARYNRSLGRYMNAAVQSQTSLSLLNIGQQAIVTLGLGVVLYLSAKGVVAQQYTLGDFVLAHQLLIQVYIPLGFLGFVYREIKQSLVDMEKMFNLLEVEAEIEDSPGAKPLLPKGGEIVFDKVNFAYEPNRQILFDVDFHVPAGKMVAIVGSSGAGKSTVSRLLFRFYDVSGGAIRIDGQDLRGITQKSLRAAIGIVPQDTVLFNDTIFYNIRYGRPDATDAEVEEAAKLAHIHDFIVSLPDGYKSMVGERGLKLSGGEKQRVAIARTILKNPPILLFDEATSALDSATEKDIQASLKEVAANRTTLVIAHRLSTVIDADEILVFEQGRIVERGRHQALVKKKGVYAAMWSRQRQASMARETLAELEEIGEV